MKRPEHRNHPPGPNGVPADYLPKGSMSARFVAQCPAIMHAVMALTAGATPQHSTPVGDGAWSAQVQVTNLVNTDPANVVDAYAWSDGTDHRLIHHYVDEDGTIGAASVRAVKLAITRLNGGHGGIVIPGADRQGVYDHLCQHLSESGVADEAIPPLLAEDVAIEMAGAHSGVSGQHSHAHSAYGKQGGDKSHEHMHKHSGDANHNHHGSAAATTADAGPVQRCRPAGRESFIGAAGSNAWAPVAPELAALLAHAHGHAAEEGTSLVAAAMGELDAPWGIEQRGEEWALMGGDGDVGMFTSYADAMSDLAQRAFAEQASRPVLAETWRSEMAYEGRPTGDGRLLAPGSLAYRDCPLPLMMQTTTDIGHFGAILAGTVDSAGTQNGTAMGTGEFDDSPAGNQALTIIQARGKFGVSIDGMSPAEAEFECTERDEEGYCIDGVVKFTLLTIGGLTMTPFPAFADAYIALENRAATASGAPEGGGDSPAEPCVECDEEKARIAAAAAVTTGKEDPEPVGKAATIPFTAAGIGPVAPPAEWFNDPGFVDGDPRLVRQDDGHYLCPLTISADGQVYGHMAGWFTCHTAYMNECVTAPRSGTNYSAYMLRPVMCADGSVVQVGHISMGCGHAPDDRPISVKDVRAHYDGGPGAVSLAQVRVGEDKFGIWFAGALDPEVTAEQVAKARTYSVSGDWREAFGKGKGLDLVACLAGVRFPGFPIRSMAAAGEPDIDEAVMIPAEPHARWVDGRPVSLVAAGVVRQPQPWERMIAAQAHEIAELRTRVDAAEFVTNELRGLAMEHLLADAGIPGPAEPEPTGPEPAPVVLPAAAGA